MKRTIVLTKKELHQLIQESIDEVIAENPISYENFLFEMANYPCDETGLDFKIWVVAKEDGPAAGQHNLPRMKFLANGNYVPISIEPEPRLLGGVTLQKLNISSKKFKRLVAWIKLNYNLLISYWNGEIGTKKFSNSMQPVP